MADKVTMRRLLGFFIPESGAEINAGTKTLGRLWCGMMRASITWPIYGRYTCTTCGRLYPVLWASVGNEEDRGAVQLGAQSLSRPA